MLSPTGVISIFEVLRTGRGRDISPQATLPYCRIRMIYLGEVR